MADKRIIDFVVLEDAQDEDLLLIASDKITYAIKVKTIKDAVEGMAQRAEAAALEAKGLIENALTVSEIAEAKAILAQEAAAAANIATAEAKAITGTVTELTEASNAAKDAANTAAQIAQEKAQAAQAATEVATTVTQGAREATTAALTATDMANSARGMADAAAANANAKAQAAQEATAAADTATQEAQAAATAANKASTEANAAKDAATTAAQTAREKAQAAQEATAAANAATSEANNAATAANAATTAATTATQNAQTQADYAKGQGDRANELLGKIEDTDIGGMAADISELQNSKASRTELTESLKEKADLVGGKVPTNQLPDMNYDPAGSAAEVQASLNVHVSDTVKHITSEERSRWNHYPISFTIAVSAWASDSSYPDYPYRASISASGVNTSDSAEVFFDGATYGIASDAGVAGFTETAAGVVYLYAGEKPTGALAGNYIIIKGVV